MTGLRAMFGQVPWERTWLLVRRYYAIAYPYFVMETHCHPELELMYVVHGKCQVSYWEADSERTLSLKDGEYCLLAGGTPHRLCVPRSSPCRVLNLEMDCAPSDGAFSLALLRQAEGMRRLCLSDESGFRGTDDGALYAAVAALQRELREQIPAGPGVGFALGAFWTTLARQYGRRQRAAGTAVYVRRALAYVEEHYDDAALSVSEIAAAAGVSVSYLQRMLRETLGCTLVDKIRALRMEKARLLLETSSLPVWDVAVSVGYNHRQHFSSTFTRVVGCSPAAYRRDHAAVCNHRAVRHG